MFQKQDFGKVLTKGTSCQEVINFWSEKSDKEVWYLFGSANKFPFLENLVIKILFDANKNLRKLQKSDKSTAKVTTLWDQNWVS